MASYATKNKNLILKIISMYRNNSDNSWSNKMYCLTYAAIIVIASVVGPELFVGSGSGTRGFLDLSLDPELDFNPYKNHIKTSNLIAITIKR
jgi:hypothetical protein